MTFPCPHSSPLTSTGPGTKRRPPTYLHAALTSIDLASPTLSHTDLDLALNWVAAFHATAAATPPHQAKRPAPQRVSGGVSHTSVGGVNGAAGQGSRSVVLAPSVSRVLPPDLAEDELPGLLEWGAEAVVRSVKWLRSSYGMAAGWGLSEATLQVCSRCNILNVTLDRVACEVGGGGRGCWEPHCLLMCGEAEAKGRRSQERPLQGRLAPSKPLGKGNKQQR